MIGDKALAPHPDLFSQHVHRTFHQLSYGDIDTEVMYPSSKKVSQSSLCVLIN